MKLIRVKGSPYWYVRLPGRRQIATKCVDEGAAWLVALQHERARVIAQMLKDDADGGLARAIAEHLDAHGHAMKDKVPVGCLGRVYFVECPARGLIKIGFTADIRNRMRTLRTSATDAIRLIGSIEGTRRDEMALHARFMRRRKFGEWFEDCPEIRAYIQENLPVHAASGGPSSSSGNG